MKLVVLGATGGIGVEIVRQAMERGHSVTAFVRTPGRLSTLAGQIQLVQGDLLDAAQLGRALEGHDGVLSGFGPRLPLSKTDVDLLERFATTLTNAMLRTAVRRAVIVSTAFLFKDSIIPPTYLFGRLFFPSVLADASAMERIVMASQLDWTLVRPPQLTDKPQTGRYRVREEHLPAFGFKIARADVANFMIQCVEHHASSRKIVGLCN
ncbi:MAG TPA: SDR family oxidoreductase [Acidobacteriaceae bacterium]|jgi:putative NADH-flavin reductase|nr:SDR family oxidoreductase [Acidobacteriaceae bacterium]